MFLGKTDEYHRTRQRLLERFGDSTDPIITERLGRACLLLPGSDEETRRAAEDKERVIAEQQQIIARLHELQTAGEEQLREKDRCIEDITRLFQGEQASLGWRLLQSLRGTRDRLFPRGGRRWQAYLSLRRPVEGALRFGPRR